MAQPPARPSRLKEPRLTYQTNRALKITLLSDPTGSFRRGAQFPMQQFLKDLAGGVHADGTRIRYRKVEYAIWDRKAYTLRGRLARWCEARRGAP